MNQAPEADVGPGPLLLHVTTVPMSFTFFRGQIGFMRDRGFRIHAASSPGSELDAFGERENVPVTAIRMARRVTPAADLLAVARLVALIRRVRPAVVHGHTPKGGLLAMVAATLGGAPVRIYHMRGLPLLGAVGAKYNLLRMSERLACRLAHRVICVSHSLREEVLREALCQPEKLRVLGGGSSNGVEAEGRFDPGRLAPDVGSVTRDRLGIPRDAEVIGFVGRIVRDKGIEELVEAWHAIRERRPRAHLLVVGPFEPQDPVSPHAESCLRTDPRVHLAGLDWNTAPLYAAMDVVALPTYREGFPNVPLEAASMRLPMVATRVPGCVDAVVDGETGLLVPPRDAGSLGAALLEYLTHPTRRREHGAAGRERVLQGFRPADVWTALNREYVELLAARAPELLGSVAAAAPEATEDQEARGAVG